MREVYRLLAPGGRRGRSTVLMRGESGTGKELVARALHAASPRAGRPFVAVNCAALPETPARERALRPRARRLHRRASSAQDRQVRAGRRRHAVPRRDRRAARWRCRPSSCACLQERRVRARSAARAPSASTSASSPRPTATSSAMVAGGRFREDLYYRLNVIPLQLPPLRERRRGHPAARQPLRGALQPRPGRAAAGFTAEARALPAALRLAGQRARARERRRARRSSLGDGELIRPEDLPETLLEAGPPPGAAGVRYHEGVTEAKRRLVQDALAEAQGNVTRAGALLGLHPNYLHRLLSSLGLRT